MIERTLLKDLGWSDEIIIKFEEMSQKLDIPLSDFPAPFSIEEPPHSTSSSCFVLGTDQPVSSNYIMLR